MDMKHKSPVERGESTRNIMILVAFGLAFLPFPAFSQAMAYSICFIVDLIWGDLGTGMAMLGICAAAAAAILGKASWGMALTVVAGVSIMFGAGEIANILGIGAGC